MSRSDGLVSSVDLGGTKARAVVADGDGRVLARDEELTAREGGVHVVRQIVRLVRSVSAQAGYSHTDIAALVIGVPGVIRADEHGIDERWAFNIPRFGGLDIVKAGGSDLGVPVYLENDLNLAAWGEWTVGIGKGTDPFAFIGVGTGIGMGLVIGGALVRGAHRHAGEIAHLPLGSVPERTSITSPMAWLEMQVRQEALLSSVRDRNQGSTSTLPHSAADVYQAASSGNAEALEAVADQAWAVAKAIAAVSLVVDPELVVLGGGMGIQNVMSRMLQPKLAALHPNPPDVIVSSLGNDAGLIGGVQYLLATRGAEGESQV